MRAATSSRRSKRRLLRALLAAAAAAAALACGAHQAFAAEQQISVTAPLTAEAVLSPADGSVAIEGAYIWNTGDAAVRMTSVGFAGAEGVGGTWTCTAGGTVLFEGPPSPEPQATDVEAAAGERLGLDWSTTFGGADAVPFAGLSLGRMTYAFEPAAQPACALLYADGSLVFQRGSAPDPGKELVAAYEGVDDLSAWKERDIPWYAHRSDVTSVTVRDPISIEDGSYFFAGMAKCTAMDLANLDMSQMSAMAGMFSGCSSLTELDLSSADTSGLRPGSTSRAGTFYGMTALEQVTLGPMFDFEYAGVCNPDGYLPEPSEAYIPGADGLWHDSEGRGYSPGDIPSNRAGTYTAVKPPAYAMLYADGSLVFQRGSEPDAGKELVAAYEGVEGFSFWQERDIPWYAHRSDVASVTVRDPISIKDGSYLLSNLSNCTSMDLRNLDTSQMSAMLYMFAGCSSLEELDLSSVDTSGMARPPDRRGTFYGMPKLRKVTLGPRFDFDDAGKKPDGYLPAPSAASIPGADGRWHTEGGAAYAPSAVPSRVAATYYAVPPSAAAVERSASAEFCGDSAVEPNDGSGQEDCSIDDVCSARPDPVLGCDGGDSAPEATAEAGESQSAALSTKSDEEAPDGSDG